MTLQWLYSAFLIALENAGKLFLNYIPYMLAGIVLGEALKLTSWTKILYLWTSKAKAAAVPVAVILGMVSPLCTYGTVPVVLTLYKCGIHTAPLIAFLAASSLMNPQLFVITLGGLGAEMAVIRLLIAFVFSVLFGYALYLVPSKYIIKDGIERDEKAAEEVANRKKSFDLGAFVKACGESTLYVGGYLVVGVLIGAIIETFVPKQLVLSLLGGNTFGAILAAALAGIPLYACGGGIIPTVSALIYQGMSKGAAMAFMTVGQATRISPLAALAAFVRVKFIVAYCVLLIIFTIFIGMIYV